MGDTHLGVNDNSDVWLDIVEEYFNGIRMFCFENGIDEILHLGDFFHHRKQINVKTLNRAHSIFDNLQDIDITIILGNHDLYYKNAFYPNSLTPFGNKYPNVTIIDSVTKMGNITLSPWNTIPEDGNDVLFSHLEVNGFPINASGSVFNGGKINIGDFSHFKQVYSGHFHTASKNSNITYIGSPFAMTFNDLGETKGFYVYEDGELEFIEYDKAPKFISLDTSNMDYSNVGDNVVRFTFLEDFGSIKNQKIIDEIQSHNPLKLQINYKIVESDDDLQLSDDEKFDISDNKQVFREYIDKKELPDYIDKNKLKNILEEMEVA